MKQLVLRFGELFKGIGITHFAKHNEKCNYVPTDMETPIKPELKPKWINHHAIKIIKTLQKKGYPTYAVGGCVRDLLLGIEPKDFDIATDARPRQVKKNISNAYIIGRRFRLVLVRRDDLQFEVATFRRNKTKEEAEEIEQINDEEDTKISGDNFFGTPKEDAHRRDFTINALFYDPSTNEVIDYCNGKNDLNNKIIRIIGDPDTRIEEDSIRIFRALRFSHKLNFRIEDHFKASILKNTPLIAGSVLPRRREEFLKLLKLENPGMAFAEGFDWGLFEPIAPLLNKATNSNEFIKLLRNKPVDLNSKCPTQLFTFLINAFVKSQIFPEDKADQINKNLLLDDPTLKTLMRDELGMFNLEQMAACKAIALANHLDEICQNSPQQLRSLIPRSHFGLALSIAKNEGLISPSSLQLIHNKKRHQRSR